MLHVRRVCAHAVLGALAGAACVSLLAQAQPGTPSASAPAASAVPRGSQTALGDMSEFRTIALDALRIAEAGDLKGARKRIGDLEERWNRAAPQMKPLAPEPWHAADAAIDRAERELRFWRARRTDSIAALRELVRALDSLR